MTETELMRLNNAQLLSYSGKLLLDYSQSMVALIDHTGRLLDWNPPFERWFKPTQAPESIFVLLDRSSQPRLLKLIEQARSEQPVSPTLLHFAEHPEAIPQSYRCTMVSVSGEYLILLAEAMPALDQRAAEEYMRVTNELALSTRNLQKIHYELERKQRQLEAALKQIEQTAQIDELTRVSNRRNIMAHLADEATRAKRYRVDVAIMLIDIDHFKQVNDRYGHPAGDDVLRICATRLQHSIRSTDHFGRYGGEEFLAVLPMTSATAAGELAQRLLLRIANEPFTVLETVSFSLTVSIGIAEFDQHNGTLQQLLTRADQALYLAKAEGRNCVRIWRA